MLDPIYSCVVVINQLQLLKGGNIHFLIQTSEAGIQQKLKVDDTFAFAKTQTRTQGSKSE